MEDNDIVNKLIRIFNINEKGHLNLHKSPEDLTERGSKTVHLVAPEYGENITIVSHMPTFNSPVGNLANVKFFKLLRYCNYCLMSLYFFFVCCKDT